MSDDLNDEGEDFVDGHFPRTQNERNIKSFENLYHSRGTFINLTFLGTFLRQFRIDYLTLFYVDLLLHTTLRNNEVTPSLLRRGLVGWWTVGTEYVSRGQTYARVTGSYTFTPFRTVSMLDEGLLWTCKSLCICVCLLSIIEASLVTVSLRYTVVRDTMYEMCLRNSVQGNMRVKRVLN